MEGEIARVTHTILNFMSLLLVGGGLLLSATFFIDVPLAGSAGAVAEVEKEAGDADGQPATPAVASSPKKGPEKAGAQKRKRPADARSKPGTKGPAVEVPRDKRLKITVPKMQRIKDEVTPYAAATDEDAFKNHAAVHVKGTGFPWNKQGNVYIAGHRLGYAGTPSWLAFWDLNALDVGDRIFITDTLGREYEYRVFKQFVVDPTDVFVTRPLEGRSILTLQTCTLPDYSRRLIVQAERVA
jgi:sortase A